MILLSEAKDPSTPPERLQALTASKDPASCAAVAENPNTPSTLLFQLVLEYPAQVFRNPILPVFLLENPGFFLGAPTSTLLAMLTSSAPHPWVVSVLQSESEMIARHGLNVSLTLAERATSGEVLSMLVGWGNEEVRARVAKSSHTPPTALGQLVSDQSLRVRELAVKNPKLPTELLLQLAKGKGVVLEWVASNPGAPLSLLLLYAESKNARLKRAAELTLSMIARDIQTPLDVLEQLSTGRFVSPRCSARLTLRELAALPATSSEVLSKLALHEDEELRFAVIQNVNTPLSVLQALRHDENIEVRATALDALQERYRGELSHLL